VGSGYLLPQKIIISFSLGFTVLYCFWAFKSSDLSEYGFLQADGTSTTWFTSDHGWFISLPYWVWTLCGVEILPLMAEECVKPVRALPKGIILSQIILIAGTLPVLLVACSIPPGNYQMASATFPYLPGFDFLMSNTVQQVAYLMIFLGGFGPIVLFMYGYSGQTYSLARAGYLPKIFARVHPTWRTPWVAALFGSFIGLIFGFIMNYGTPNVQDVIITTISYPVLLNYIIQMISFIILRVRYSQIRRPFRAPFGFACAIYVIGICVLTLLSLLIYNQPGQYSLGFMGIYVALGACYFFAYSRTRLRFSPEESFAYFAIYNIKFQRDKKRKLRQQKHHNNHQLSKSEKSESSNVTIRK